MSTSSIETPTTSPTAGIPHHYTTQAIVINASAGAGCANIGQIGSGHESNKLTSDSSRAANLQKSSSNMPMIYNKKIGKINCSANNNFATKKSHRKSFNSSGSNNSNSSGCISLQHAMQLQHYRNQSDNSLVTPSSSASSSPVSLSGSVPVGASTSAAVHHRHNNAHQFSFQQQHSSSHHQHHQVGRPTSSSPSEKINLRLILVSGKTKEFLFNPSDSAGDIAHTVFNNWPDDWSNEAVSKADILRLIYQGRFLHCNVTLGALGLPLGKTTVMHLVPRDNLPEPNSQDQRQKSKSGSGRCCSTTCCIL